MGSNNKIYKALSTPAPVPRTAEITYCTNTNSYQDIFFEQPTPLSNSFFADLNVEMLRRAVSAEIKRRYGLDIAPQPWKPFKMVMMRYFRDIAEDLDQWHDVQATLDKINAYTLNYIVDRVHKNIQQQLGYLRYTEERISGVKLPNPVYTRPLGKELQASVYYNGTNMLPENTGINWWKKN